MVVLHHECPLEDVKHVGVLVEEQPIWTMLDGDAKEVVKWPEDLHGEFQLKSGNSATYKLRAGGSKDDIINI
jgi:hypothetical protein